jgi:predicted phosphohydrolase
MKLEEVAPDFDFLSQLKGTKIIIRGNHDYWWSSVSKVRDCLPKNTYALQNDAIKINDTIFCGNRGWIIPEGKQNTEENQKIYAREVIRLELSLKSAKKLQTNNERIVFITHYPPFNNKIEPSEYTRLLEEYGVSTVIFGHLHGYVNPKMLFNEINGIKYYLTSCDAVKNKLIKID